MDGRTTSKPFAGFAPRQKTKREPIKVGDTVYLPGASDTWRAAKVIEASVDALMVQYREGSKVFKSAVLPCLVRRVVK